MLRTLLASSAPRRERPPLALITEQGIDLPFALEHAEEWAYIQEHYLLVQQHGPEEGSSLAHSSGKSEGVQLSNVPKWLA